MSIDTYFGIGKPEEKKPRDATNPVIVFTKALEEWIAYAKKKAPKCHPGCRPTWVPPEAIARLQKAAAEILEDIVLPNKIGGNDYFTPLKDIPQTLRFYAGLYYTTLLNKGKIEHLIVPHHIPSFEFLGYSLKKGIIELYADGGEVGLFAKGGCIVNYAHLKELGFAASGGAFVNKGTINKDCFGFGATRGIFIEPPYHIRIHYPDEDQFWTHRMHASIHLFRLDDEVLKLLERLGKWTENDYFGVLHAIQEYTEKHAKKQ